MYDPLNTEFRASFEAFKSNVCHLVKDRGDIDFMIDLLEKDKIREYWNKQYYAECLYLLAMLDYLSRINDIPLCAEYSDIRCRKLTDILYPAGIMILRAATGDEEHKKRSIREAIPEFLEFNIVESEIRNVC